MEKEAHLLNENFVKNLHCVRDLFVAFEEQLPLLALPRGAQPPLIEWRIAFGDLFFRIEGAESSVLWCDPGHNLSPKRPISAGRLKMFSKRVSTAWRGRNFFRVVPFSDGDGWALVRPKRALVKSRSHPEGALWFWDKDLRYDKSQLDWLSQPQSWFEEWLREREDDETLRAARRFLCLEEQERLWAPVEASGADKARWFALAQALHILAAPMQSQPENWEVGAAHTQNHAWITSIRRSKDWIDPPLEWKRAQVLKEVLDGHFALPFDPSRWRGLCKTGEHSMWPPVVISHDEVSHHERMEAALLWRDFARQIGRERQIEAKLRELLA